MPQPVKAEISPARRIVGAVALRAVRRIAANRDGRLIAPRLLTERGAIIIGVAVIVTVVVAEPPGVTDAGKGAPEDIENPGTTALPDTTTCCEPLNASSVMSRFALASPAAVGAYVTLMVHLADG